MLGIGSGFFGSGGAARVLENADGTVTVEATGLTSVRYSTDAGTSWADATISGDSALVASTYGDELLIQVTTETGVTVTSPSADVVHVFLLAGQSNMVGQASDDGGDGFPAGTQQWNGTTLSEATSPLLHSTTGGDGPSIGQVFAASYVAANPGVTVVLVPAAYGGSGFVDNYWNPGDSQFTVAVNRVNSLLAAYPDYLFKGILWHQGERDGVLNASASYQANLIAMVDAMRSQITGSGTDTPFVCGGLLPSFTLNEVSAIKAILADAPNFLDYCGYADSASATGALDDRHFNAASLRVMGAAYYSAYLAALADAPALPAQVQNLTAVADDGSISLSWDALSGVTGYYVYRTTTSGSGYTLVQTGTGTSYVDTGLTNDTTYYYVVSAYSGAGEGSTSTEVAATPVATTTSVVEAGAIGHWHFGTDYPAYTGLVGGTLTANGTAPTLNSGYMTIEAGKFNGLVSTLDEPTNITMCMVVRLASSGLGIISGGTLRSSSLPGGCSFVIPTTGVTRCNSADASGTVTVNEIQSSVYDPNEFFFVAFSHASDGSWVGYKSDSGGNVVASGTSARVVNDAGLKLSVGPVHFASPPAGTTKAHDVAEYIYFDSALTQAQIEAVYARSVARLAARGVTLT